MKVIFLFEMLKYLCKFQICNKACRKFFGFEDNCGWTCFENFCQLWQEYLCSPVNMLQKGPKTTNLTMRHNTQLNLFAINGKLS